MIQNLHKQVESLLNGKPAPELAALAKEAQQFLLNILLQAEPDPGLLQQKLQLAIQTIGRSIERELADLIRQLESQDDRLSKGLLGLVLLRRELAKENHHPALVAEIDRFIDGLRLLQFLNSRPDPTSTQGQWLRLNLPIAGLVYGRQAEGSPQGYPQVELRIAYLPDQHLPTIDANQTRFVVRVALEDGSVAVDVSVAQRKVGVQVTASTQPLLERAEQELPSLQHGFEQLGYQIQTTRCELGEPFQASAITTDLWAEMGEVQIGA
jgi:exonuclease VII small subunit